MKVLDLKMRNGKTGFRLFKTIFFLKENNGFYCIIYSIQRCTYSKNGILKVYWDDSSKSEREEYTRLTDDEFTRFSRR